MSFKGFCSPVCSPSCSSSCPGTTQVHSVLSSFLLGELESPGEWRTLKPNHTCAEGVMLFADEVLTISCGGCSLHFSKERRAEVPHVCCMYPHWYCTPVRPWNLSPNQPHTAQKLYLLHHRTALAAMPLLCSHLQQETGQASSSITAD